VCGKALDTPSFLPCAHSMREWPLVPSPTTAALPTAVSHFLRALAVGSLGG
jgi:hypothetical protein